MVPTHKTAVGDAGGGDAQAKPGGGVQVKVEEGKEGEPAKGKKTRKRKPSSCEFNSVPLSFRWRAGSESLGSARAAEACAKR